MDICAQCPLKFHKQSSMASTSAGGLMTGAILNSVYMVIHYAGILIACVV